MRKELFFNHLEKCCISQATATTRAPVATVISSAPLAASATALVTAPVTAPALATIVTATTAPVITVVAPTSAPRMSTALTTTVTMTLPATGHHIPPKILKSKRRKTTCCFCNLRLKNKNLKMHIQRRHSEKAPHRDITANHHLQSCVLIKKGIFAVSRTFKGPVCYIHMTLHEEVSQASAHWWSTYLS